MEWNNKGNTDTWRLFTNILADGVLGERKSENAIRAATAKATVVKKPKTFCPLTREECMLAICGVVDVRRD